MNVPRFLTSGLPGTLPRARYGIVQRQPRPMGARQEGRIAKRPR